MSAVRYQVRGWHVLAAMLAFFGAVIAVNTAFIVYAVRTFPGEDVRRSYLQGLNYNETLADRGAQAALGWRASAALVPLDHGVEIEVILRARDGAPVTGANIVGELQWPTTDVFDRALAFEPVGDGRYRARVGELDAGRWRLRAQARRDDVAFDLEAELTWPASQ